jgi:hypothetical protein
MLRVYASEFVVNRDILAFGPAKISQTLFWDAASKPATPAVVRS